MGRGIGMKREQGVCVGWRIGWCVCSLGGRSVCVTEEGRCVCVGVDGRVGEGLGCLFSVLMVAPAVPLLSVVLHPSPIFLSCMACNTRPSLDWL